MFVMSIYALCTAAITFSSRSRAQILAARILNCKRDRSPSPHSSFQPRSANVTSDGYVGMELAVVPVFQSEIVPKQVRGLVVETYQLMLFVRLTAPVPLCRRRQDAHILLVRRLDHEPDLLRYIPARREPTVADPIRAVLCHPRDRGGLHLVCPRGTLGSFPKDPSLERSWTDLVVPVIVSSMASREGPR